jgi:serine/threonine protein kinase
MQNGLHGFNRKPLASLNHPHIGAIYGIEETTATTALVLELVEGPTLADRIAKGSIPLDEALPIAKPIAEALEAAHEQGIIHRDLKPANVKLRPDGMVSGVEEMSLVVGTCTGSYEAVHSSHHRSRKPENRFQSCRNRRSARKRHYRYY